VNARLVVAMDKDLHSFSTRLWTGGSRHKNTRKYM